MTDATVMQIDAPLHHAVPAFPAPFSNSNEDSLWSYEENELNDDDFYQGKSGILISKWTLWMLSKNSKPIFFFNITDFGGVHTVPLLSTKLKNATRNNSVRSGKKIGATPCKDPSKMFSGSIRLQSILFARSIAQLASTTELTDKISTEHALVEIIGKKLSLFTRKL